MQCNAMQYPGKCFGCQLNHKSSFKVQALWSKKTAFIFLETKFKDHKKEKG